MTVPAGSDSVDLVLPTVADGVAEPEEQVRMLGDPQYSPEPRPVLTGTVTDST